jgi:predicted enzyme related to lactoylglutathione lyase
VYPVKDIKRARDFYENTLGFNPTHMTNEGQYIEYDMPEGGCFALTTLAKSMEPNANSGGRVAFEVDNLDQLISELKAKGIVFKTELRSSHGCRLAIILDSEGNSIILHQLK